MRNMAVPQRAFPEENTAERSSERYRGEKN
jgi:hypothetical protein